MFARRSPAFAHTWDRLEVPTEIDLCNSPNRNLLQITLRCGAPLVATVMTTSSPRDPTDLPPVVTRVTASVALWLGLLAVLFAPSLLVGFVAGVAMVAAATRLGRPSTPGPAVSGRTVRVKA